MRVMGVSMTKVHCVHVLKGDNETHYFVIKQKCQYWWFTPVMLETQETGGLCFKGRPCTVNRRTYLKNKLKKAKELVMWMNWQNAHSNAQYWKEKEKEENTVVKKESFKK